MSITEFKQWWNRFSHSGNYPEPRAEEINYLLSELDRLTAELKDREGEVEKLTHERDLWENMAAMRLADQERIEKHTEKRVARECAEIAGGCYYAKTMAEAIKKKYGVE